MKIMTHVHEDVFVVGYLGRAWLTVVVDLLDTVIGSAELEFSPKKEIIQRCSNRVLIISKHVVASISHNIFVL